MSRIICLIYLTLARFANAPLPNRVDRAAVATVDSVLQRIGSGLHSIRRLLVSEDQPSFETARRTEEDLRRNLIRVRNLVSNNEFEKLQYALDIIAEKINEYARLNYTRNNELDISAIRLPRIRNDTIARRGSFYDIDRNRFKHFLNIGFSVRYIARNSERLLGGRVHHNTLHLFIHRNNMIAPRQRFTEINDNDLKIAIRSLNRQFPNSGAAERLALLRSRAPPIFVPRDRCRRVLAEVDPEGAARRWAQAIRGRQYSVPSPNALWHMDTNHALVR